MYTDLQCEVSLPLSTLEQLHFADQMYRCHQKTYRFIKKGSWLGYLHASSYQMATTNSVIVNNECRYKSGEW